MKRYFPIAVIVLTIIGLIVGVSLSKSTPSPSPSLPTPTPPPYPEVDFRGIDISTATEGAVISTLGKPLHTDQGQSQKTLMYAGQGNQPINVNAAANNKITSIIEPAAKGTSLASFQKEFGKEDVVLYGTDYYSGYFLYTYLSRGTAVLANPTTDTVKSRWYFSPVDITTFLQTIGVGFQTKPLPSGQE